MFYNLLKLKDFIVPFICFVKHWKNVIKSNFSSTKCEGISTKKNPAHPNKNLFFKNWPYYYYYYFSYDDIMKQNENKKFY